MSFSIEAGLVTLRMSTDDFQLLLIALGEASGSAHGQGDLRRFYNIIALANRLAEGSPGFIPYGIPEEYR